MQLTRNFNLKEFHCKDGTDVPYYYLINVYQLAIELQKIRDEIKTPLIVTSGYRTPQHNKDVGGVKNSYHLKALGVDLKANGISNSQLFATMLEMIQAKKIIEGELITYSDHVHYSINNYLL